MYFKNRINVNIPLEKEEIGKKGFIEEYLPFLSGLFGKKDTRLVAVLVKIGEILDAAGINDSPRMEINGKRIFSCRNCGDDFDQLLDLVKDYDKTIKKIHLIGQRGAGGLEVTSVADIELDSEANIARIAIKNFGMVQIPESVNAESFEEDARKVLKSGYLEACEKSFAEFSASLVSGIKNTLKAVPTVSTVEKTVIVPAKKDRKSSKFYNRDFAADNRVSSPAFYRETGISPSYTMGGYTDPFEIFWWMMIYDSITSTPSGSVSYADSAGKEISAGDANRRWLG